MRSLVVLSVALLSCGSSPSPVDAGTDAGSVASVDAGSDAGVDAGARPGLYADGGSMHRYWDGGTCAVKTDCPCFSSDDCGPGFTCHSEDTSGLNVWCVPGARGTGGVGATCTTEADCLSALCVSGSSSSSDVCSALCETTADCPPAAPRCQYIGFGVERSLCRP